MNDGIMRLQIYKKAAMEFARERAKLLNGIRMIATEPDKYFWLERQPWRWHLNGKVLSGCYEGQKMELDMKNE